MNYTVIARRWRPKRFNDVIGQAHIVATIKNSLKYNRIAHAYLFTGPRGVGKTSLARILSKAVNCLNRTSEEPCGECENCLAIDHGTFPDIVEIDAASAGRIEEMRSMLDTVRYLPMKGLYKVYILDESHMLTAQAKDAFLKTLEEPPGHNIFVLATTEVQKIPYTIMSRCQRFDFRRIPESEITAQLKRICDDEGITYDEGVFSYVAVEADGSLRDAESILDQVIAYCGRHIAERDVISIIGIVEREVLHGIIQSIFDNSLKTGLEIIEGTLNEGYDVHQIYRGLVEILRHMMILKVWEGLPPFLYMGEEEYTRLSGLMAGLEYYEIQNMLHYLLKAEDLLKGPFPKVSLEILYINLYNLSKLRDVDRVISTMSTMSTMGRHPDSSREKEGEPLVPPPQGEEGPWPMQGRSDAITPSSQEEEERIPAERTFERNAQGFVEYLKEKMPLVGNMLDGLVVTMEEGRFVVHADKASHVLFRHRGDDMTKHLREFFGTDVGLVLRDGGEVKRDILEEYVREAESLFKI
ncbi:DNA polymerase III subunit gamma/tau [Syntrophorhabdus aromaticivorans]|uniref:DNA polymerase III subunit gamma/tau n=1 Tax=Syntrophorhabdus aromaticivorans TaxID=328301 RepID=A0A971M4J8_9BACT|nr:DNA polymerase III subunit gamma/tau [Syntrophorhabdus aromaticivorans]NLW35863.1 DNA polymerase III subunit gamma/tau [Syntrophorhabdus aromaticivorans]